jgi:hypothetical protein
MLLHFLLNRNKLSQLQREVKQINPNTKQKEIQLGVDLRLLKVRNVRNHFVWRVQALHVQFWKTMTHSTQNLLSLIFVGSVWGGGVPLSFFLFIFFLFFYLLILGLFNNAFK